MTNEETAREIWDRVTMAPVSSRDLYPTRERIVDEIVAAYAAALAAAEQKATERERERCAKMVEDYENPGDEAEIYSGVDVDMHLDHIAAAIRAGEK